MDARGILHQAYETQYLIHDHLAQSRSEGMAMNPEHKRPLSSVAQHPAEDFSRTSSLYHTYLLFTKHKVYQASGMDWPTFISLPHDFAEYILEVSAQATQVEDKHNAEAMRRLQAEMNGTAGPQRPH